MLDRHSVQTLAKSLPGEAIRTAARERLASEIEEAAPKKPSAARRVAQRLRALALASARRVETAAE